MQEFKFSDLTRNPTDVRYAATREPVMITERNKPRFVIMSYDDFQSLKRRGEDPRRVLDVGALGAEDRDEFLKALEASILPEDR